MLETLKSRRSNREHVYAANLRKFFYKSKVKAFFLLFDGYFFNLKLFFDNSVLVMQIVFLPYVRNATPQFRRDKAHPVSSLKEFVTVTERSAVFSDSPRESMRAQSALLICLQSKS